MAKIGFRKMDEMIGRADHDPNASRLEHWKAKGLDYSQLLFMPPRAAPRQPPLHYEQDHGLDAALDDQLIEHG